MSGKGKLSDEVQNGEKPCSDLHITPQGNLRDEENTFTEGNGVGLLLLTQKDLSQLGNAPGELFFQKIFQERLRRIAAAMEPSSSNLIPVFSHTRPSVFECSRQVLSAPSFLGIEYFDGDLLYWFHQEFEHALQMRFSRHKGSFTEFLRSLSPIWENIGKVTFHLAENKGDKTGKHPFAFMASFIYWQKGAGAKNLPLAAALQAYVGNSEGMAAVLEPIRRVAERSAFIRNLLESRRIFKPAAWTGREAYAFLRDIPICEEENIVVRIANLWKAPPPKPKISVSLDKAKQSRLGQDALLDFSVAVSLNGERLTANEVREILDSTGGLVRIKGQWIEADTEKIAKLLDKWKAAEALAREEGLSLAEGLRLLAGADVRFGGEKIEGEEDYCTFEPSGELQQMFEDLRDPKSIALPNLPGGLDNVLRPYQLNGVKYLWRASSIGLGTCLADDMGLGKTLQILTLLSLCKKAGELDGNPALLVLPATLLANWKNESEKFTPELKLAILHRSAMTGEEWEAFKEAPEKYLAPFDLALVTYGMLPRLKEELADLTFPAVIADEAQAIKTPSAQQSRAVRKLHGRRRIALTGTPVENRLSDLWSIFDFINPGLLGSIKGFMSFTKEIGENYTPLRKLTRPFILRRLKTDKRIISDLPDKTEMKAFCSLSKKQAVLYAHCVKGMREEIEQAEGIKRRGIVLSYLTRFKQICNHPAQFLGTGEYTPEDSGKFLRLAELVEPIAARQEKVLVFTQFREIIGSLHDFLRTCFGRNGLVLHGGTPVRERIRLVEDFQREDGPPFFVLSLRAAGVGLNLTAANHVIHFDRWWNPAVENQASDRAFRIGQKRNVLVHKFISRGTLEEKIDALIMDKQNLADELLRSGAEKLLTDMNNEELMNLVSLDIDSMEN